MSTIELADLTASAMLAGYAKKNFSPSEVMASVINRIEEREPIVKALWAYDPESAIAAAAASTSRWTHGRSEGELDGIPVTIKENIATQGVPVPLGTAATILTPAISDAPPAARMRESRAIIFSKSTMPDLGMLTSGASSFHALTSNPWNPTWNPGGSSAGGGAAAAAGYGPLHIGTDIGGSLRLPAAWSGLYSLKPSNGRVPIDPAYIGRVAGPLTRTVADSALMMKVLSKPDRRDSMVLPPHEINWSDIESFDPRGKQIALHLDSLAGTPANQPTRDAISHAAEIFSDAGAHVKILPPFFTAEMLHDLDLFWRVRAFVDHNAMAPERRRLLLPFIFEWLKKGGEVTSADLMRCLNRIFEIKKATQGATEEFDFVLSPTSPVMTFPVGWAMPSNDPVNSLSHIGFTVPYNMSDQPAASINAGVAADGRHIGLQISGRRFDDLGVLQASRWFEKARPSVANPDWTIPSYGKSYGVDIDGSK